MPTIRPGTNIVQVQNLASLQNLQALSGLQVANAAGLQTSILTQGGAIQITPVSNISQAAGATPTTICTTAGGSNAVSGGSQQQSAQVGQIITMPIQGMQAINNILPPGTQVIGNLLFFHLQV